MKKTAIKVGEDLLWKINKLKYQWGFKTQEAVLRRLIEISSKFIRTSDYSPNSSFFSGGPKTTSSKFGTLGKKSINEIEGSSEVEAKGDSLSKASGGTFNDNQNENK